MYVHFEVMCDSTELGETVYAVGSATALGAWGIRGGVRLKTSTRTFPVWKSKTPVYLSLECMVDFKFVIISEAKDPCAHCARWEELGENRRIQVQKGFELYVRASWNDPKSVMTMWPLTPERSAELESGRADFPEVGSESLLLPSRLPIAALGDRGSGTWCGVEAWSPGSSSGSSHANGSSALYIVPGTARMHKTRRNGRARPGHGAPQFQFVRGQPLLSALQQARTHCTCGRRSAHGRLEPVVIVSSEMAPYAQTGGLGLVVASLAREFAWRGHRTMVVTPMYDDSFRKAEGMKFAGSAWVRLNDQDHEVRYYHCFRSCGHGKGCDHVLLDHACFQNRPLGLYCVTSTGEEYSDNLFRFALLSLAGLEAPLLIKPGGFTYGEEVVFLANDWQAGLVSVYMRHKYRTAGVFRHARVLHVVHNLAFQGAYDMGQVHLLGLRARGVQDLEMDGRLNIAKAALLCADLVVAVSPSYANEIQTKLGGSGLDRFARQKAEALRLVGILNGIDGCWDPAHDLYIEQNYTAADFVDARARCKAVLQSSAGLRVDPSAVLLGYVGRLAWQKGVDMLIQAVGWLVRDSWRDSGGCAQIIFMGEGDHLNTAMVEEVAKRYPGRVCGSVHFDVVTEHRMMAGCDLMLMPSRYEPCGLPQMIAQSYGALPIVTDTGGLHDTVRGWPEAGANSTGFLVPQPLSDSVLRKVLLQAVKLYHTQLHIFRELQHNAMERDFYWPRSIDRYQRQISRVLSMPPT
mmetsp:Transcript_31310/g.73004  ORF Transcript_31310/g.73004 Transcript_31310/m.73004 type:complete len:746 (+) Transcript_31310:60-2297(+)